MRIQSDVLDVLGNAEIHDNHLRLVGKLDRRLYTAVNRVLEDAGASGTA